MPEQHYTRVHPFCRIPVIHPALLFDDCESTFIWRAFGTGDDWTAEHDPSAAHVQTNGILLKTRATTPTIDDSVTIYRTLWLPPQKLLRLQVCFNTIAADPSARLHVIIVWYDGELKHYSGLRFTTADGSVEYLSDYDATGPIWTALPDWEYVYEGKGWNKLDLSVNIAALIYHIVHVNEHVIDGSAVPLSPYAAAVSKYLHLEFVLQTLVATQAVAYLDQVLLTPENP